ncbi:MAG: hypothetical protein PHF67_01315 [Candidatus Nanoarchaeia archaeon]|nr:hypothetical protein [Candidatus Nanoarchaeia archaeon]
MAKWTGWVAALGGLLALIGQYVPSIASWAIPLGAVVAIIFGAWAALAK